MSEILDRRRTDFESLDACDLLVIGGGITGSGIAREAAYRGMRTVLVEKDDYAQGTSSRSSKLVHGGLRYLEQFELKLVYESTRERSALMHIAPHLVRPITFLYPVYKGRHPGMPLMAAAMLTYDALSLFRAPQLHRLYGRSSSHLIEPLLRTEGLVGTARYFDGATDDARLTLETVLDAQLAGAKCFNHTALTALEQDADAARANLRCDLSGQEWELRAKAVVLAVGPWTDRLRRRLNLSSAVGDLLRATRGSHLVIDRARLPLAHACVMGGNMDGRVTFAIPWDERVILGTTDLDDAKSPEEAHATAEEVSYLLATADDHFPEVKLGPGDVIATYSGLRPLIREEGLGPSQISREHAIFTEGRVLTIAGGKLTTYRSMAEQAVDRAVAVLAGTGEKRLRLPRVGWRCRLADRWRELADGEVLTRRGTTARRILPGAVGLTGAEGPARIIHHLTTALGDARVAQHLASRYGGRSYRISTLCRQEPELARRITADLPTIWAEVPFAVQQDLALTLSDVLDRRMAFTLRDRNQGLGAADRAAELLAPLLSWDGEEQRRQVEAYADQVALSRRWRGATGH